MNQLVEKFAKTLLSGFYTPEPDPTGANKYKQPNAWQRMWSDEAQHVSDANADFNASTNVAKKQLSIDKMLQQDRFDNLPPALKESLIRSGLIGGNNLQATFGNSAVSAGDVENFSQGVSELNRRVPQLRAEGSQNSAQALIAQSRNDTLRAIHEGALGVPSDQAEQASKIAQYGSQLAGNRIKQLPGLFGAENTGIALQQKQNEGGLQSIDAINAATKYQATLNALLSDNRLRQSKTLVDTDRAANYNNLFAAMHPDSPTPVANSMAIPSSLTDPVTGAHTLNTHPRYKSMASEQFNMFNQPSGSSMAVDKNGKPLSVIPGELNNSVDAYGNPVQPLPTADSPVDAAKRLGNVVRPLSDESVRAIHGQVFAKKKLNVGKKLLSVLYEQALKPSVRPVVNLDSLVNSPIPSYIRSLYGTSTNK